MAGTRREEVKVVLIHTQYVETDATNFKTVVQRLTGKDSCVACMEESSFGGQKTRKPVKDSCVACIEESSFGGQKTREPVAINGGAESGNGGGGGGVSMLSKGMSFKDLDRLIMEVPPMDDLLWLWTE